MNFFFPISVKVISAKKPCLVGSMTPGASTALIQGTKMRERNQRTGKYGYAKGGRGKGLASGLVAHTGHCAVSRSGIKWLY